jgi:hypothetical protein
MSLQALPSATSVSWVFNATQNGFAKLLDKVRQIVVNRLATPWGIATVGSVVILAALARRCLQPVPKVNLGGYLSYNYKVVYKSAEVDKPENAQIVLIASKSGDKEQNERLMAEWQINKGQIRTVEMEHAPGSIKSMVQEHKKLKEDGATADVIREKGLQIQEAKQSLMKSVLEAVEHSANVPSTVFLVYNDLDVEVLRDQNIMDHKPLDKYSVVVLTPKIAGT